MIIAITGGIGSGKSVVSQLLRVMGHAVYDCDKEAQRLMAENLKLRQQLCDAFGEETYTAEGKINKPYLIQRIFSNPQELQKMNSIVHPAVARDFLASGIMFVESAILFEAGFDQLVKPDVIWSVTAPLELRISRAMLRDHADREKILARINSQMDQEEKNKKADAIIWNDGTHSIIAQVNELLSGL